MFSNIRQFRRKTASAVFLFAAISLATSLTIYPAAETQGRDFTFNNVTTYPASPYKVSAQPYQSLSKRFVAPSGSAKVWTGGDAAYSIPLSSQKTLWLFGDSFFGLVKNNQRLNSTMVHNVVAIEDRKNGTFKYFPGKLPEAKSKSEGNGFFTCQDSREYYWPGHGYLANGKLFLFMHVVRTDKRLPPPFQFELRSDHLITIDNPLASPDQWHYQVDALNTSAKRTLYGVTCLTDAKYQYVFCSNGSVSLDLFKHPAVVSRISRAQSAQFKLNKLEWWSQKWEPVYELPETLFEDAASEMSVVQVPGMTGYFAFYIPPDKKAICMRHADQPQGPWCERVEAFKFPNSSPDILFYSAKAHPQYLVDPQKNKGEIILTYCTNSSNFAKLASNANLYVPQSVKITVTRK